jgi:pyruvate formate lyase activating enzyme
MRVSTIIDVSLVDVPKIPVTVIFTAGCNFNCYYCQNAEIIPLDSGTEMTASDLANRAKALGTLTDGYCVTGGEPTIQKDLPELLRLLREPGKHINLNTQGSVPSVLEKSLPYLDSVWFDIKTSPAVYQDAVHTKSDPWARVRSSIEMIMKAEAEFWPRTTYVGGLLTPANILDILEFLKEVGYKGEYLVQNYIDSAGTRDELVKDFYSAPVEELDEVKSRVPEGISLRLEWR